MFKKIFLVFSLAFSGYTVQAQCTGCATLKNFQTDYCHVAQDIKGICGHFGEASEIMIMEGEGVSGGHKEIQLPKDLILNAEWLISLSNDKKIGLTVAEALFLNQAIPKWKIEKRFIGMEKTASGLEYKMTKVGTGKPAVAGKKVHVHYRGTLLDGTEFDSSYKRGTPLPFILGTGNVIKGWDEGIGLLKEGGAAILRIPPDLGYGARGAGASIPPNATLIFEVELITVE